MTKEQQFIKDAYDNVCGEWKEKIKQSFPDLVKSELPKSWGEYCEIKGMKSEYLNYRACKVIDRDVKLGYNKEYALFWEPLGIPKKYVALRKLELLRDHYNDGLEADWTDTTTKKYLIRFDENGIINSWDYTCSFFLNFKTKELRNEFLKNFKDLILQAKELL